MGLAVPDWPTTFGINMFIYNFWHAPFGVRVEHFHRLYGAAVGLATIGLAGWFLAFEGRRYLKILGVVALATVIIQGILGGTRVTQVSTFLAAVHGCLGQAFFGLIVALCVLTGRVWNESEADAPVPASLRRMTVAMLVLVYAQVAAGAWFRHYRSLPALGVHVVLALGVVGHAIGLSMAVASRRGEARRLVPSATALATLAVIQIVLGLVALGMSLPLGGNPRTPTLWEAMSRTAHQTNGALLLASAVVMVLRAHRRSAPETTPFAVEAVA